METVSFTVHEDGGGERLDHFVARMTGMARAQAQRLICEGSVRVDGSARPKNHRLHPGERVDVGPVEPEDAEPQPQDIPIKVVYEDADLAVISKPAGIVVHPAAGHRDGTLVNALLFALRDLSDVGGAQRRGIVHRLDRDTSGLMVVAKNDGAHRALQKMVATRELKRRYLALVHGVPATRLGTVDAPIGRDPRDRKKMAVTAESGLPSLTDFEVIEDFGDAALLAVELLTGRTHQIRVHLSFIGFPVAGDPVYGRTGGLERELGLSRQFLHACNLSFPHPTTGEPLECEEALPPDLDAALLRLRSR